MRRLTRDTSASLIATSQSGSLKFRALLAIPLKAPGLKLSQLTVAVRFLCQLPMQSVTEHVSRACAGHAAAFRLPDVISPLFLRFLARHPGLYLAQWFRPCVSQPETLEGLGLRV